MHHQSFVSGLLKQREPIFEFLLEPADDIINEFVKKKLHLLRLKISARHYNV